MHFEGWLFVFFLFFPNIFVILLSFHFSLVCLAWRQSVFCWETKILFGVIYICPTVFIMWKKGGFGSVHTFQTNFMFVPLHNCSYYRQKAIEIELLFRASGNLGVVHKIAESRVLFCFSTYSRCRCN